METMYDTHYKESVGRTMTSLMTKMLLLMMIGNFSCDAFSTNSDNLHHHLHLGMPAGNSDRTFKRNGFPIIRSHTETVTCLFINGFPWFSGKGADEEINESSSSSLSPELENLGGVAGIMDSLESFRGSQKVGERTNTIMQELSKEVIDSSAADGKVKVTFDGHQRLVSLKIDDAYFESLIERADAKNELIDVLTAAFKSGYSKSSEKIDEKMKSFYSDLLSSSGEAED